MRVYRLSRQLQKLIFIFPVIWVLYTVYEMTLSEENNTFDSLAHQPDKQNLEEQDLKRLHVDNAHESHRLHNVKRGLENVDTEKLIQSKRSNERQLERLDIKGKGIFVNNTLEVKKKQQLEKFFDIGGVLVDKRHEQYFANVNLPDFNNKRDPSAPGESGFPVKIDVKKLSPKEKSKYDEGWASNSFNQYASDLISIHRSLSDGRSQA